MRSTKILLTANYLPTGAAAKKLIDQYIEWSDFSQVNLQLLFRPLMDYTTTIH